MPMGTLPHLLAFCLALPILVAEFIPNGRGRTIDSSAAENTCRCAEEETFSEMLRSGAFKSPGFPNNYCDLLNCRWNIQPAEDTFVSAALDFFETEAKYDALEIYQTRWNGSQLLVVKHASLSGNFDGLKMERHFFSSLGGGLMFRFVTDNTDHNHPGFQISFQRHNKDDSLNAPCPNPFLMATEKAQNLPALAAHFRSSSSCIFVINSTEAIKFTVKRFVASVLRMQVFETENFQASDQPSSKELLKIQGVDPTPLEVSSRTSSLTVLISSVAFFLHSLGQSLGSSNLYDIQFERTKSVCECFPSELVVSRIHPSELHSPGYPLEYCDAHNCSTRVSLERPLAPRRQRDTLEVLRIRLEQFQTEAYSDYVTLKALSESDKNDQFLIMLTDDARQIRQFTFDVPQFGLDFITDHSIVSVGFNMSIELYQKPKECICPGTILEAYKHSEQNEFDSRKCKSMDCFWEIRPPKPTMHRLLMRINHTLVDPGELLYIYQNRERGVFTYQGDSSKSGEESQLEFDEMAVPPMLHREFAASIGLSLQSVTIWYHRELADNEEPWLPERSHGFTYSYEWREVCQCGEPSFHASAVEWRVLHSPDYPHFYCRMMRCQWLLEAPEGHHLLLNITHFATEADQDFLTLFDGNDTSQKHMDMLSGLISFKSPLHSERNQMTLLFNTDASIQMDGFEIMFKAVPNEDLLAAEQVESTGLSKFFLFALFLAIAVAGILVLVNFGQARSGQVSWSNNLHMPSWLWRPIGGDGIGGFMEGRVRFIRNLRQHGHGAGAVPMPSEEGEDNSSLMNQERSSNSGHNPLFNPFR